MWNIFFSQEYIKISLKNHFLKKYVMYKNRVYIYSSDISNSFKHSAHRICKSALVKEFYVTTKTYVKLDKTKTLTPPFKTIYEEQQVKKKTFSLFSKQLFYSYLSVHEYFITEGTRQTYFFVLFVNNINI